MGAWLNPEGCSKETHNQVTKKTAKEDGNHFGNLHADSWLHNGDSSMVSWALHDVLQLRAAASFDLRS